MYHNEHIWFDITDLAVRTFFLRGDPRWGPKMLNVKACLSVLLISHVTVNLVQMAAKSLEISQMRSSSSGRKMYWLQMSQWLHLQRVPCNTVKHNNWIHGVTCPPATPPDRSYALALAAFVVVLRSRWSRVTTHAALHSYAVGVLQLQCARSRLKASLQICEDHTYKKTVVIAPHEDKETVQWKVVFRWRCTAAEVKQPRCAAHQRAAVPYGATNGACYT